MKEQTQSNDFKGSHPRDEAAGNHTHSAVHSTAAITTTKGVSTPMAARIGRPKVLPETWARQAAPKKKQSFFPAGGWRQGNADAVV